MLEPLSILSHRLVSLGQLKELYFLSVSHAIRKVFRQKLPFEGLTGDLFMFLFHDQPHVGPQCLASLVSVDSEKQVCSHPSTSWNQRCTPYLSSIGPPDWDLSCHQTWSADVSRNPPSSIQGVEVGGEDCTLEHQSYSPTTDGGTSHDYNIKEHTT